MEPRAWIAILCASLAVCGCTVVRMGPEREPARVESSGLVDGHVAFGVPQEDDFLRASLFSGSGDGVLAEVGLWKLFRLEVGLAGASVGLGPLDVGLGVLFYEPSPGRLRSPRSEPEAEALPGSGGGDAGAPDDVQADVQTDA